MCVAVVTVAAPVRGRRLLPVGGKRPPDGVAAPQVLPVRGQRPPDGGSDHADGKNHKKTDARTASTPAGHYPCGGYIF